MSSRPNRPVDEFRQAASQLAADIANLYSITRFSLSADSAEEEHIDNTMRALASMMYATVVLHTLPESREELVSDLHDNFPDEVLTAFEKLMLFKQSEAGGGGSVQ